MKSERTFRMVIEPCETRGVRSFALSLGALVLGLSACAGGPTAVKAAKTTPHSAKQEVASEDTDQIQNPSVVFEVVSETERPIVGHVDRRPRSGQTRGHERTMHSFRVADLPATVLRDPLDDKDAPTSIDGDGPPDLAVKKNAGYNYNYGYNGGASYQAVSVVGNDLASGTVRVGGSEGAFLNTKASTSGGVTVQCAPWSRVMSARWEGLMSKSAQRTDNVYEIVDGWFDLKQCKAVAVRRTKVPLTELIPDTLYAFRQCSDLDCSGKTSVVLVVPNATQAISQNGPLRSPTGNPLARFVMPVKKGGSESVMATLPPLPGTSTQRTVSVEISQGTADPEPLATAFVADVVN